MAAITIYSDFGAKENKVCHYFHTFPIYLMHWRRKWQPTPVFLPGEFHGYSLMAESEEQKSLLMKKESEKVGVKLNIQKTKIVASGPITSWQIMGKQWKQ